MGELEKKTVKLSMTGEMEIHIDSEMEREDVVRHIADKLFLIGFRGEFSGEMEWPKKTNSSSLGG